MRVRVEVNRGVLEWARVRSGTGDELWTRRFARYGAWHAGEAVPTLKQLEGFACTTHTPETPVFVLASGSLRDGVAERGWSWRASKLIGPLHGPEGGRGLPARAAGCAIRAIPDRQGPGRTKAPSEAFRSLGLRRASGFDRLAAHGGRKAALAVTRS